jgi:hypothetical protein
MDGWMVRPHDEIMQNLLTSKTGYVEIASRLGFGINLIQIMYHAAHKKSTTFSKTKFSKIF